MQHAGLLLQSVVLLLLQLLLGNGFSSLLSLGFSLRVFTWTINKGFTAWIWTSAVALLTAVILSAVRRQRSSGWIKEQPPNPESKQSSLRPLIFPCKTTHTRLFPKKHSFEYSYLQVGIPVGWKGSISGVLGAEEPQDSKSWFTVNAGDYLARGQELLGLEGKLRAYLEFQGERFDDYYQAYLVTAPRFLGYAFNPVSFWYLFSKDLKLQAMILEVNNTFDERRMYFMKRSIEMDGNSPEQDLKFTHSWPKDFHVSPFNSRKGDYSLAAVNPFAGLNDLAEARIDNVITLSSSKQHAKIVARLFSPATPIDPASMSSFDVLRLISAWFWVGFMTFPRILKEAGKLFFQRKPHVWYRPEVVKTSIGRKQTSRESIISQTFLALLQHKLSISTSVSAIEYTPPNGSHLDTLILNSGSDSTPGSIKSEHTLAAPTIQPPLKLQILTPQFYTDIATTPSVSYYILASEQRPLETRTFVTSSPEKLAGLIASNAQPPLQEHPLRVSFLTRTRMNILNFLRSASQAPSQQKPRHSVGNELDIFCATQAQNVPSEQRQDPNPGEEYVKAAMALVLSERLVLGFDAVLDGLQFVLASGIVWQFTGLVCDGIARHV